MPKEKTLHQLYDSKIAPFVPSALTELIGSRGVDVVKRVGVDVVKKVIADVLCGRNLRDSTEMLTRRRIGMLNAATLIFFVKGLSASRRFIDDLPAIAAKGLTQRPSKQERWMLQWILGLTGKGVQNVLRDSDHALDGYRAKFIDTNKDILKQCENEYGPVAGNIALADGSKVALTWQMLLSLFCTIGSQTLAIRGSEKSTYGKLFERLILGSVLEILGFTLEPYPPKETRMVFWLSSRLGTRESDATALIQPGQAVRFDIGFIGRGNPEISKDKVSRFEREVEIGGKKFYSATFIIVDRIGERSKIVEQAKAIYGTIVQMSMSFWPQQLARELRSKVGFDHELCDVPTARVGSYLRRAVSEVRIERFVEAVSNLIAEEKDEPNQENDENE